MKGGKWWVDHEASRIGCFFEANIIRKGFKLRKRSKKAIFKARSAFSKQLCPLSSVLCPLCVCLSHFLRRGAPFLNGYVCASSVLCACVCLSHFLRRGAPFLNGYVLLLCPLSVLCLSHLFVWENLTSVSERYIFTNIF
jgi:hypothetical protein